jgi:hypothetical protein
MNYPDDVTYQVISGLFERRQHQRGIPGFLNTESRDTENFTLQTIAKPGQTLKKRQHTEITHLVRHGVGKDTDMTRIDVHTVRLHGRLNLGKDGTSSSFNTQNFMRFHDVIGSGLGSDDT